MKLPESIRTFICCLYGISEETIDISSPQQLAALIREKTESGDIETDHRIDVAADRDSWKELDAAGVSINIVDSSRCSHPKDHPFEIYVSCKRNGEEVRVNVPNRKYPVTSDKRYHFEKEDILNPRSRPFIDAAGIVLQIFIDPEGFDYGRYSQERNLNLTLVKLESLKKNFMDTVKQDVKTYPALAERLALPEGYESLPVEELLSVIKERLLPENGESLPTSQP